MNSLFEESPPAFQGLSVIHASVAQLHPAGGNGDEGDEPLLGGGSISPPGEELPYRVEVWDETGAYVERVIAMTANVSIGYAAYYAAANENPGRVITLCLQGRVISKWSKFAH